MDYYILFVLSFIMLFIGGELLVKSSVSIALRLKISSLVVGMTVVSFATSSPELFVSIKAAFADSSDIVLGNVIGSNIANISLVLGLTALVFPIRVTRHTKIIDYPFMLFASILFGLVLYYHERFSLFLGLIFISILIFFVCILIKKSRKEYNQSNHSNLSEMGSMSVFRSITLMIVSIFLLSFGSDFLINGAKEICRDLNIAERVISVSMIAIGTSIPELATSLVAAFRKEENLAIGNLIGSNIFNIFAVIGITSIFKEIPLRSPQILTVDYFWMICIMLLLAVFIYVLSRNRLSRKEGGILFLIYLIMVYNLF